MWHKVWPQRDYKAEGRWERAPGVNAHVVQLADSLELVVDADGYVA